MGAKFIQDNLEIKFLILFILSKVNATISAEKMQDVIMVDDGIDVFSYYSCLNELVDSENIIVDEEHRYRISEKGLRNSEICESSIPYSVRIKVSRRIDDLNDEIKRQSQIKAHFEKRSDDTYVVNLVLNDDFDNLMSLQVLVSNEDTAKRICKKFNDIPEKTYMDIITLLSKEDEM